MIAMPAPVYAPKREPSPDISPTELAPKSRVYVARRGLSSQYGGIATIEEMIVEKTTAKGFKLRSLNGVNARLHRREEYHIHPQYKRVAVALRADIRQALADLDYRRQQWFAALDAIDANAKAGVR